MNEPSPRPWSVSLSGYQVFDANGRLVCLTLVQWGDAERQKANARLIVEAVNGKAS
jgi:hypothetical protein